MKRKSPESSHTPRRFRDSKISIKTFDGAASTTMLHFLSGIKGECDLEGVPDMHVCLLVASVWERKLLFIFSDLRTSHSNLHCTIRRSTSSALFLHMLEPLPFVRCLPASKNWKSYSKKLKLSLAIWQVKSHFDATMSFYSRIKSFSLYLDCKQSFLQMYPTRRESIATGEDCLGRLFY